MRQIPIQPLKRKCSGCGDIMTITKSDYHNNYILFDGKLYHKDCYFKTKTITKKCYECKRNISFPPITATLTHKYVGSLAQITCEMTCHRYNQLLESIGIIQKEDDRKIAMVNFLMNC